MTDEEAVGASNAVRRAPDLPMRHRHKDAVSVLTIFSCKILILSKMAHLMNVPIFEYTHLFIPIVKQIAKLAHWFH